MIIEQDICKRVSSAIQGVLNDVAVDGNWLGPTGTNPKGAEPARLAKAVVTVGGRGYPAYSAAIVEIPVRIDFSISIASDPDLSRTLGAYEALTGLLEAWHGSISSAKAALGDGVCGVRLSGGDFDALDDEKKFRTFYQNITIKTRSIKL